MRRRKQAMMTTLLRLLIPVMRRFDEQYPAAAQAHYRLSDCLLSVLAMFVFKQPNWFRFEPRWRNRPAFLRSLQHWFQLEEIPSDAHYLVAVDGTGGVSSTTIHCDSCLHKHHRQTVVAETGEELPLVRRRLVVA